MRYTVACVTICLAVAGFAFGKDANSVSRAAYAKYAQSAQEQTDYMAKVQADRDDWQWKMVEVGNERGKNEWLKVVEAVRKQGQLGIHAEGGVQFLYDKRAGQLGRLVINDASGNLKRWMINNYLDRVADTQLVAKKAEANLVTKGQKDFLDAWRKFREVAVLWQGAAELRDCIVLAAAYTGPFISREGRRDNQAMAEFLRVKAEDHYLVAVKEYRKARARVQDNDWAQVVIAVMDARGKSYVADRYRKRLWAGVTVRVSDMVVDSALFGDVVYHAPAATPWRKLKEAFDANGAKAFPTGERFSLTLDPGASLPWRKDKSAHATNVTMPSKDELLFIYRQIEFCWQNVLNPPEPLSKDKPQFTCWMREAESDEPPLLVRASVYPSFPSGHKGGGGVHYHLSNSFLKGLCSEWRQEMDAFEASLPTDGVSQQLIDMWRGKAGSYGIKYTDDEKKWWTEMDNKEVELYKRHFAVERLKWRRISEETYSKLKMEQDEWVKSHISDTFSRKQALASLFQNLAVKFDGEEGSQHHTLDALERMAMPIVVGARP